MTDEQPLHFVRYAPSFYSAIDMIQNDIMEREQNKSRASSIADRSNGPRFSGRIGG